jgi:hypothetical protein
MAYRYRLIRSSFIAMSLLAASFHVAASDQAGTRISTREQPLTQARVQGMEAARALAVDGRINARVNGSLFFATGAYASESVFWLDGKTYLDIHHARTPRGSGVILSIPVKDGQTHVGDGRYEFHVVPPELAAPRMNYYEPIPAPPGFEGLRVYEAESGWVELRFNVDRTHVDATFEFDAQGDDGAPGRVIRKGEFSMPNFDLPSPAP